MIAEEAHRAGGVTSNLVSHDLHMFTPMSERMSPTQQVARVIAIQHVSLWRSIVLLVCHNACLHSTFIHLRKHK